MITVTTAVGRTSVSAERRFFLSMAMLLSAVVLVGFSRSFFLRPLFPDWPSPHEHIFYVHGVVLTAWFVLLITQASLISSGRVALHRILGAFGVVLAIVLVVLTTIGALIAAGRASGFVGVSLPGLQFLIVPLMEVALFGTLFAVAVCKRGIPQIHKRAILLATIALLTAAFARWPFVKGMGPAGYFGFTDLCIVPLLLWDQRSSGRVHPVTLWGGLAIIIQPLALPLTFTPAWLSFARWAAGLLG